MASSTPAVGQIDRAQPDVNGSLLRRLVAGLGPLLLLYAVYSVIRYLVADRGPALGLANADLIIAIEQHAGIFRERGLQAATLPHHWLVKAANWYYVLGFLPMLVGGALLAAWRAPKALFHWRGIFVVSLLIAIVGYTYFPLTPPRLLPHTWGFVDTLTIYGPQYYGDHLGESLFNGYGALPNMVNVYAAMPSMHVAWSAIAGALIAASFSRSRSARLLIVVHPALMALAVVVTANHYLLDVIAGLVVLAAAIAVVRWYERRAAARRIGAVESQPNALPSVSTGD